MSPCNVRKKIKLSTFQNAKMGIKTEQILAKKLAPPKTSFVPYRLANTPPGICVIQCNQKYEPNTLFIVTSFQRIPDFSYAN